MPVSRYNFYKPADSSKKIAILSIQPQNLKKDTVYNFYNIVLFNGEKKYFPVIVRYFHGNSVIGFDWGYNRAVQGDLKLKFGNNGPYTIILAYLYDEGDTFDKCAFFDKYTVDFDTNLIKQDTKIDSFN
ncbi:MAG: hypothetical protein P8107_03825 [Spirochaetia bacterium]